jgi:release factor glutamine methyltransferase
MTYKELLTLGTERLQQAGCPDSALDAWYLLEYVTGMSRTEYYLAMLSEITEQRIISTYEAVIEQRQQHIPLQYITGSQEFMGLTFHVNEQVLIPRQDTEVLVEQALDVIKHHFPEQPLHILDLCTGSGCILISLLVAESRCTGVGADISEGALAVAKGNAEANRVAERSRWLCSDLFAKIEEKFSLILSNPPYIATGVLETLMPEVIAHEPIGALDGKEDGLFFYRQICGQAGDFLETGGYLMFEIGYDQGQAVSELMQQAGFMDVKVLQDYCGKDRVVMGHL